MATAFVGHGQPDIVDDGGARVTGVRARADTDAVPCSDGVPDGVARPPQQGSRSATGMAALCPAGVVAPTRFKIMTVK